MKSDTEYLWNADPAFWNRSAPLLFPIVGKLRDNSFTYNGISYVLPQHGFVRDSLFELQFATDTIARFFLTSTEDTKKVFPFDFELYVHYVLEQSTLHTTIEIMHPYGEPLIYAVGTHPAFAIGVGPHAARITSSEPFPHHCSALRDGLIDTDTTEYAHEKDSIELLETTFAKDALIFKGYTPREYTLHRKDGATLSVSGSHFSHTALWSKPHAPFVCIEHWTGHADDTQSPTELSDKKSYKTLQNGSCQYELSIKIQEKLSDDSEQE
jgi:galactose mutarotase-like enzyme